MPPTLLLLPGLGGDHRLFHGQIDALGNDLVVPRWPELHPQDSMAAFATRLADTLPDVPPVIGGASFGGMVAWELAAILRPKAVVLIGSCTTPAAIPRFFRMVATLGAHAPDAVFRPGPWLNPFMLDEMPRLKARDRRTFWDMARDAPPAFLKWGCGAIVSWQPTPHDVPVFHLHGAADRIIPASRVAPTEIVQDAGHLLSLSHPDQTTRFLRDVMGQTQPHV